MPQVLRGIHRTATFQLGRHEKSICLKHINQRAERKSSSFKEQNIVSAPLLNASSSASRGGNSNESSLQDGTELLFNLQEITFCFKSLIPVTASEGGEAAQVYLVNELTH